MIQTVQLYYDRKCEDEWQRLVRHRLEYEVTKRILGDCLPAGARVLDVGGGPGRYSIWLASQGHSVTLLDLSAQNVNRALEEARQAGVRLEAAVQGNALLLDECLDGSLYDVVLCMGPLYHLHEAEERTQAIRQCLSVLKPGGVLAVSFISAFAPIVDCLKKYPQNITEYSSRFLGWLTDGREFEFGGGFTDAYYIHPEEARAFMEGFGLTEGKLFAVEGLAALAEPTLMQLPEEQLLQWADLCYRIAEQPAILGACEHLLYVGSRCVESDNR